MVTASIIETRLRSLDFYRGLIMVLLMLEGARLYDHLAELFPANFLIEQFFHHPWSGLRFWDLVQPAFMFIAGVSMAYSVHRQQHLGTSWHQSFIKMLTRSGWLFFWGVLNYAVRADGLSFELWNVLTQLSVTLLIAFLIFNWSVGAQLGVSVGLLLVTELLYRFTNIPGFDQPFTDQHNFGNYIDLLLMNKINSDGWVAINCLPTAAHTIWGALVGKLLLQNLDGKLKLKYLLVAGFILLLVGYSLNAAGIPIIKRISTTTFVLVSGGWCLLLMALFYWWVDLKQHTHIAFFAIVGMNSIFIYLFFEIVGARWFNEYVLQIVEGVAELIHFPTAGAALLGSVVIFALEWGLCFFLYKKKIFFKL
ncbi:MAG: DUF5009 domain-containing protein [Cytophagales bacterium]|nr:DUF5009 domain-containing protein [Cytophagales bacterium]